MTNRADLTGLGGERSQVLQCEQTLAQLNLAVSVPISGNVTSGVILSNGWLAFSLGLTSSQTGSISIQRYLDLAGTVAQGAAITAALTAATPAVANVTNDGKPWATMIITVANTSASTIAALTAGAGLWQSAT